MVVRDEYYVPDILECARKCVSEDYCKSFAFRIQNFYVSSSANNCQLTALDVHQTLNSDFTADSTWNIYQRVFSSICNDFGGSGGGILNPTGIIFNVLILKKYHLVTPCSWH